MFEMSVVVNVSWARIGDDTKRENNSNENDFILLILSELSEKWDCE
jgi:hypothetical protein